MPPLWRAYGVPMPCLCRAAVVGQVPEVLWPARHSEAGRCRQQQPSFSGLATPIPHGTNAAGREWSLEVQGGADRDVRIDPAKALLDTT